ncbi:MAG: serine hydrolase [Candidatus Omnitrophota bacterium]
MMIRKKVVATIVAVTLLTHPAFLYAAKQSKKKPIKSTAITAKSFFVMRLNNNQIMLSRNSRLKLAPASTAKLMSALLVMENSNLTKPVVISRKASNVQPSKVYMRQGERYQTGDLLKAVLICSANDASVAIAEDIASSEKNFVRLMNKRAKEIGATNTHFVNATGLPVKGTRQYTTAHDLVLIMKEVLKHSTLVRIMHKRSSIITSESGRVIMLKNHNKLLKEFDNAIIGKTGYTIEARHCFVGVQVVRNEKYLFAILKSRNPRQDIRKIYFVLKKMTKKHNTAT